MDAPSCHVCQKETRLESFCLVCRELHCDKCSRSHSNIKATKHHSTFNLRSSDIRNAEDAIFHCDGCKTEDVVTPAIYLCWSCQELQCERCNSFHSKSKITKEHRISKMIRGQGGRQRKAESYDKQQDRRYNQNLNTSPSHASDDTELQLSSDFAVTLQVGGASHNFCMAQAPIPTQPTRKTDSKPHRHKSPSEYITKMVYQSDIDVGLVSDKKFCQVAGVVCLHDGRVVILDINNMALKVYNTDYKYLFSVEFPDFVFGVTVVSPDTVVVIEGTTVLRYVHIDTHSGTTLPQRINTSSGDAVALSYAVGVFYVLCTGPWRVEILGESDTTRKFVSLDQAELPALSILLDDRLSRIYICDRKKPRVLCYSSQWTGIIWECRLPIGPFSVVTVGDTLLAVCTDEVFLIDTYGKCIQEVNVQGERLDLLDPLAVVHTKKQNNIIVASFWGSKVKVFRL